jgi:Ca-activated chloride channel family protein
LALKQTQHQSQLILETAKASESNNKQVLILISDGDNLPSRFPIWSAVNYAKFLKVPIYTIGVGSDSAQADKREFRGLLYQTLKDDQLKLIAEETQGRYFKVGNKKELDQVLREIDQLEGVPLKEETVKQKWQSLYFYPLSFAFILMLIYLVLISRSQTTRGAL